MPLDSEITIRMEGETIRLRPTLLAAYRLERRYGGFDTIVKGVEDGKLTVLADIVTECSDRYSSVPDFLKALDDMPLRRGIEAFSVPLLSLVLAMAGLDEQRGESGDFDASERMTFTAYHEKLFGIGCGVLGWPPAVTWDATAAEILAAYRARMDMLAMLFGSDSRTGEGPREHSPAQVMTGLATLRTLTLSGQNKAA